MQYNNISKTVDYFKLLNNIASTIEINTFQMQTVIYSLHLNIKCITHKEALNLTKLM